jgi:oxygen-independent coproporphyrinogen-3 oxidase
VTRLHLGGGSPNHLSDAQLWRLMEILHRRFRVLPETTLSIECDPRRCSATQMATLRALGFRHVMFGMADLLPDVQLAVGRLQSPGLMRDAVAMARAARFESVQVDLLCGLPLQSLAGLDVTLEQSLKLGPDRIACLRYEHRPDRFWNQCAIDREALPDASLRAALWRRAADRLTAAGYEWIGCSLFVLEGDELAVARERGELACNRLGYASLPADHVLAFGCGRISDVADTLVFSEPAQATWRQHLAEGRWPVARGCRRSEDHRRRRRVMKQLLCDLEVPRDAAARALGDDAGRLAMAAERGWIEPHGDRLVVTRDGRYQLDGLCGMFGDASPPAGRLQ